MDPFNTKSKKKSNPKAYKNFIEAFKDIGSSVKKTVVNDLVKGSKAQKPNPDQKSTENFNFEEYLQLKEKRIRNQERTRFETIRREEKIIFSREQKQVKIQIETLQVQIKQLATEQVGLMKEVDKAAFQAVVSPGVYHQNFFERLLSLIKLAKKNLSESKTWLHLHNHRAKKRGAYWSNVKKSGTKFMLSQERYMSTQAG